MNAPNPTSVNRIFCCFPIFCPSEKMFQRNMASVVSFVEYVKVNPHLLIGTKGTILDCYWGGWALKDEWYNEIQKYIKDNFPVINGNMVKTFRYDKNYGKSKIVNDLAFEYLIDSPDAQFMFTMDSDIKFMNSQIHFFDRLMLAAKCREEVESKASGVKKNFALVSLNQAEANYHWIDPKPGYTGMDQNATYEIAGEGFKIKEEIVWPSDRCGIAGGALFLNLKLFKQLGGYSVGNHPYHGEDGFYLKASQEAGACVCIIKSMSVLHPVPEDDQEYLKWKESAMKETWNPFDESKNKENIEKSMEIWKSGK